MNIKQIKTAIIPLLTTLTMVSTTAKEANAQATATGAIVNFIPSASGDYIQTVGGSLSVPVGNFGNTLTIIPVPSTSGSNIEGNPTYELVVNPGGIDFNNLAPTLQQQAAIELANATGNLSQIISILRANPEFLRNPTTEQAIATGESTLMSPGGSMQTISGEISLPAGLYFKGLIDDGTPGLTGCADGTGCFKISPFVEAPLTNPTPIITELSVNAGAIDILQPGILDFHSTAANLLTNPNNTLAEQVSIIRAVKDSGGVFSTQVQARAMGSITVTNPDGLTMSVSGEMTLPAGLFFGNAPSPLCAAPGTSADVGCVSIYPEYLEVDPVNLPDYLYITELSITPGEVLPGNPFAPSSSLTPSSFDLNASAAAILYSYADPFIELSNVVSVIRAGAGQNGLSPDDRPSAFVSGSATLVLPNGAVQSVTGELSLPNALYFSGGTANGFYASLDCTTSACLVITPSFTIDAIDPNLSTIDDLVVDGGPPAADQLWDFDAAAGFALDQATQLHEQVSIIRAGAGAGLE
ncbi:hypothetical protein [Cyanobacterium sp. Dongsha4]|uniref:hypothetical protein n=1 Tax=Cyanobacterium sp. DS4 TaxID=2878255 RepID=UPI002E81C0AF|nr:hypothetical protein [Cyanobacterium sp. Dongsha4]WVK99370.1 hypothetical protein Dongsha4_11840 [Cyanobacterium sp. Dongsha4]